MTDQLLGWPSADVAAVAVGFFLLDVACDALEVRR